MNFVNRQFPVNAASEVVPRDLVPSLRGGRKWPIRYQYIEAFAICSDFATIFLASVLSTLLYHIQSVWIATDLGKAIGSAIVVSALFVCLLKIYGRYRPYELLVFRGQVHAIFLAWTLVFFLLASAVGALKIGNEVSRGTGLIFALLGFAMLVTNRAVISVLLRKGLSARKFAGSNIVLITDQQQSSQSELAHTLEMFGFCVTAHFSLPPLRSGSGYRKELSARVIEHVRGSDIEEIVVEANPNRWHELRGFVADLMVLPFPVVFAPVGTVSEILRRRRQRCGFDGRSFAIYKFRTMPVLEDDQSITQARQWTAA